MVQLKRIDQKEYCLPNYTCAMHVRKFHPYLFSRYSFHKAIRSNLHQSEIVYLNKKNHQKAQDFQLNN